MLFNIYYINFSKVHEIKMMMNNKMLTNSTEEGIEISKNEDTVNGKAGAKLFKIFDVSGGAELKDLTEESKKVVESFDIKTTKSTILKEVISKTKQVEDILKIEEGTLIKLDSVKLNLINEYELRTVKMLASGAFKGMDIAQFNGFDLNNLSNSLFKDYAYKIKGIDNFNCKILFKIPLTIGNEFENQYSIDDLFIGKVSIIGIYKGIVKIDELKNSFDFFQELGQTITPDRTDIEYSDLHEIPLTNSFSQQNDTDDYHYIDIISIVQNIIL